MSTRMVRVVTCDRCGAEGQAPTATDIPRGWSTLQVRGTAGVLQYMAHLCVACSGRAVSENGGR